MFANFIYPRLVHAKNFRNKDDIDCSLFILPSLMRLPEFQHYIRQPNNTWQGLRWRLIHLSFITHLAFTYFKYNFDTIEISPFYEHSLVANTDKEWVKKYGWKTNKLPHHVRTSDILKKYIEIDTLGHKKYVDGKLVNQVTSYRVTDALKSLADEFLAGDFEMYKINIKSFIDNEGLLERITSPAGVGEDGEVLMTGAAARWYGVKTGKKYKIYTQAERHLKLLGAISEVRSSEFTEEKMPEVKEIALKDKVSFEHTVKVNRDKVKEILSDPFITTKYSSYVVDEMRRILKKTTDESPYYNVKYRKVKSGRHYVQGSTFQSMPRELREQILDEYAEVDVKSAIFSIYKNLSSKYGYKGDISEIEKMAADPKAYRMALVKPEYEIGYEEVKTILTAIAYGARSDMWNMYHQLNDPSLCMHRSSLLELNCNKRGVIEVVGSKEVQKLITQIHKLGRFLIKKHKRGDEIINSSGCTLELSRGTSYGAKMAHIYQSIEADILEVAIGDDIAGGSSLLGDGDACIGLCVHDGFYVQKSLIERSGDFIVRRMQENIKKRLGFEIFYDIKM